MTILDKSLEDVLGGENLDLGKEDHKAKLRVDTPEGGLYFWSFMHVDGPKIKLRDKSEESE